MVYDCLAPEPNTHYLSFLQGMYVLGNISTGSELHKEAVMHQLLPESPSLVLKCLQCSDTRLRVATIWCIVNLTYPGGPGSATRVARLRDSGIISQVKSMVNDPCLDAKVVTISDLIFYYRIEFESVKA